MEINRVKPQANVDKAETLHRQQKQAEQSVAKERLISNSVFENTKPLEKAEKDNSKAPVKDVEQKYLPGDETVNMDIKS